MKLQLMAAAALAAALVLPSCSGDDARLAGELAGTWKGKTTEMMQSKKEKPDHDRKDGDHKDRDHKDDRHNGTEQRGDAGSMLCTPTLTFVRTDGTNGGTFTLSADYTVTKGVETAVVTVPVNATVNGTLQTSGTWTVKDGDEVVVVTDPSKTAVEVDANSMTLSYARLTDAPKAALDSIKSSVAANLADAVKPMIAAKVQKMHKFDDVKITGDTMRLEAGHAKLMFTKQ